MPFGGVRRAVSRLTAADGERVHRLTTRIRTDAPEFLDNQVRMTGLVKQLRDRTTVCRQGGGPRYLERHRQQGKLPVRERIDLLLDPGSPFLELSALAAWGLYDNEAPGAGIVTGIGQIGRASCRERV